MKPDSLVGFLGNEIRRDWADLRAMAGLVSRLPVGGPPPELPRALAAMPLAGAFVGAIGGAILSITLIIGLPPLVSSLAAVAMIIWLTGALHEDGLADTVDGFGGGGDPPAKLEIMRDSRIGTYGAAALTLSIIARIALIATLVDATGPIAAACALAAAGGLSRAGAVHALWALPPVRDDGLGRAAGTPNRAIMIRLSCLSLGCAALLILPSHGITGLVAALAGITIATLSVERSALRHIGGQTGDVCGALQQAAEICCLTGLAAAAVLTN